MNPPTRADAVAMDADDELGAFRATFLAPEDGSVLAYLDGNSLGRPPVSTLDRLSDLVRRQWGTRLIRSWSEGWFELPEQIGDELGSVALGAAPGQVILGDSTTVLLYKVLRAAVAARPGRREIVTDVHNFPTDRYVVEGVADELGCRIRWLWTDQAAGVTARQLADVLGTDTAVVTLSHVAYRSAYLADMGALTRLVHDAGALTVWDLCHSVGSVPVELDALGVDFAVGCTYKFLCGGPGSPAFAYVAARHQADLRQPIWGWIGRVDPFAMAQGYRPAAGMRALLSGTPPVLALAGVAEGVALVAEAGIDRIRAKAMALAEMAVALTDSWLAPHGVTLASPRDPAHRGAHVTISRHDAEDLAAELIAAGVIIDFRPPDGIRIGLAPLSTGFDELWRGMDAMRRILAHHEP